VALKEPVILEPDTVHADVLILKAPLTTVFLILVAAVPFLVRSTSVPIFHPFEEELNQSLAFLFDVGLGLGEPLDLVKWRALISYVGEDLASVLNWKRWQWPVSHHHGCTSSFLLSSFLELENVAVVVKVSTITLFEIVHELEPLGVTVLSFLRAFPDQFLV